jgi:hypothetical protein
MTFLDGVNGSKVEAVLWFICHMRLGSVLFISRLAPALVA